MTGGGVSTFLALISLHPPLLRCPLKLPPEEQFFRQKCVCTNAKKLTYRRIKNISYRQKKKSNTKLSDISFCMSVCNLQSSSNKKMSLLTHFSQRSFLYSIFYSILDYAALPIKLGSYLVNYQIAPFFMLSLFPLISSPQYINYCKFLWRHIK